MALSIVGTPPEGSADGANITLNLPGTIADGDVVYVGYAGGTNANTNANMAMVTGSYQELCDLFGSNPTDRDVNLGVFRKRMSGTPDSTAVTTATAGAGSANVAVAHVWRGVDASTPEDATTTTVERAGDTTPVNTPSIVTVTDGAVVLTIGASPGGSLFTPTAPSGYGNLQTINLNASGAGCTIAIASKEVASHGTEDPGDWGSWAVGAVDAVAGATVAIRPAPTNPVYEQVSFRFFADDGSGLGEAA
jgi:hypothetical protein